MMTRYSSRSQLDLHELGIMPEPMKRPLTFNFSADQSGWNCVCLAPSWDNSGNVQPYGGTDNPKSFLTDYGDKLGAVYERFHDKDIRKQNYVYNETTGNYQGIFLKGAIKANYGKGAALKADADRDGQDLVYVDQQLVLSFIMY